MKNKLITILLAICLICTALFMFTACSNQKGDNGVVIETVWIDENGHLNIKYTDGQIKDLGLIKQAEQTYSQGLKFELNQEQTGYILTGIGTCNDRKVVIPSEYNDKPVVAIGYRAFAYDVFITEIVIPDSVTSIGEDAFSYCGSLTSIVIPDSVTSIGENAFYRNSTGGKVNYLGSIDSWVQIEFANGKSNPLYETENFYINNKLVTEVKLTTATKINDYAFYFWDSLTSVVIPDSVTSIGSYAFSSCGSLTSIVIPDSVTSIGSYAFSDCDSLTSIEIPNSVTSIGTSAFRNCDSLTSVVIPDSVTSIGSYAFSECYSLTSIVIPDSVTSIGDRAFYYCTSLTSVTIGNSVTSIGYDAFAYCSSLTSVTFNDTTTWYRTSSSTDWTNKTGGTQVSVTSPTINAGYFDSTYYSYYWYKK